MDMRFLNLSREQIDTFRNFIFEKQQDIDVTISRLLLVLGFKPQLYGTVYLHEAIIYCYLSPLTKISFSKAAYPYVAQKLGAKPRSVERNIRTALNDCYNSGSLFKLNYICGCDIISTRYVCTNSEFIMKTVAWNKSYYAVNAK